MDLVTSTLDSELLAQFGPRELSSICWSLAKLRSTPRASLLGLLLQALRADGCAVLHAATPQALSNVAWSLAVWELRDPEIWAALQLSLVHQVQALNGQDCSVLLWSLAKIGLYQASAWPALDALCGQAVHLMPSMSCQSVSNVAWAVLQLRGASGRRASEPTPQARAEQQVMVMQAVAAEVGSRLLRAGHQWQQAGLHAAATTAVAVPAPYPLTDRETAAAAAQVGLRGAPPAPSPSAQASQRGAPPPAPPSFRPLELTCILTALAKVGCCPRELAAVVDSHVHHLQQQQRLRAWPPQALANLAWSAATIGPPSSWPHLLEALHSVLMPVQVRAGQPDPASHHAPPPPLTLGSGVEDSRSHSTTTTHSLPGAKLSAVWSADDGDGWEVHALPPTAPLQQSPSLTPPTWQGGTPASANRPSVTLMTPVPATAPTPAATAPTSRGTQAAVDANLACGFKPQELAVMWWSLARLHWQGQGQPGVGAGGGSSSSSGISSAKIRRGGGGDRAALQELAVAAVASLPQQEAQGVAMIAWAMARLGFHDDLLSQGINR